MFKCTVSVHTVCIGIWKVEELFWTIPQRIFSVFYARPNPDQTARMIVDIAQHKNSLKQRNYYFSVQFVITIRNIRLLISTKQKRPSSSDESVSVIKMNFKWHWLSWLFVSLLWNKTTLKLVWPTSDFVFIIADRQVIRNRKFTFWWTALFREAKKTSRRRRWSAFTMRNWSSRPESSVLQWYLGCCLFRWFIAGFLQNKLEIIKYFHIQMWKYNWKSNWLKPKLYRWKDT